MVANWTHADQQQLKVILDESRTRTDAGLQVYVLESSASYRDYALGYGLAVGLLLAAFLGMRYPGLDPVLLLVLEATTVLFVELLTSLIALPAFMIPERTRHRRARKMAGYTYRILASSYPDAMPLAVLFISLQERYVHVLTSPALHHAIPGQWEDVTKAFAARLKTGGNVRPAVLEATEAIVQKVSVVFPANAG